MIPSLLTRNPTQIHHLQTLAEIDPLVTKLAKRCPNPDAAHLGLTELLVNAIEHGNLGIGFEEKTALVKAHRWQEEIARRAALPENEHKQVTVRVSQGSEGIQFAIIDEGTGFAWQSYLLQHQQDSATLHGRGILVASRMCFDEMHYNATGNQVTCFIANQAK